ncbi:E3 SUMO-protein ligase SIZ1 isoform X1 [Cynara cardunculus var. scolymus]|uniref:E3 SUMO-protein ligase SIZ1 isoform X1 n=2 Tax=Cynara cardunculus var. scolymus TaxID=59895 RepID=UPI000D6265FF|nr:E3 SUMO-protein ligase SIZ1 isoform X1 [Cynara cardunculus var. scolymus]
MDLVTSCKEKLAHFRIKELKDILTQLGLSKQGKKQDLVDRILAILSDDRVSGMWAKKSAIRKEEVAKLVDDIYRKMQIPGASDLASKGQGVSDITVNTTFKEEVEDTYRIEKVRCPCGSSLQADAMIKCEDHRCNVWQHIGCVIIPEKPVEGILPAPPPTFYCELCRLGRADPFWVPVGHPLYPVKLTIANAPTDGTSPVQSVEKSFQLTKADRDLLGKPEFEIQAWCMLLNDKVSFRMQWPQYADLQINGMPVRAINRPGSQLLGANGRDDGPVITQCTREGSNKISLTGCDARVFCLGVRIVKRRTVQQILNLIPKECDGERFEDAVARVCRCVGGGPATEDADSDSDLEVVADSIPVNLRCPMSGSRMRIAGRFKHCAHMGCFDLEVFVQMNQRSRKWQCPICLKNYSLENVIIDPYFTRITTKMRNCGEDLTEIEVKPDGCWRAKADNDQKSLGELGQWHLPNGTLCVPVEVESKPKPEPLKLVKQEGVSEHTSLKLGIKKNRNGIWEVSKPENLHSLSSGTKLPENFVNNGHNVIPMSSSATGSGRDGEDPSINQDGGGHFGYSTTNGADLGSLSPNIDPGYGFTDLNPHSTVGDADIIVLSDSDEETENLMSSVPVYKNGREDADRVAFSVLPNGITEPHNDDPALIAGGNSCLGLFNSNDDDFGPFWNLPSTSSQGGPSFQLFGSDENPVDALIDVHHGLGCPTSMDGFTLTAETAMGSAALVPNSSVYQSNVDMNDGLVDNPLAFGHDDPSLQLFLPTRPTEAAEQVESRDQPTVSKGLHGDDWISLSLGGGGGGSGVTCEPAATNGLNSSQPPPSKDGALDSFADTASLLLGMNGSRSGKSSRERSKNHVLFPRQKRSVRPRLYLSIDTDSEEER